MGKAKERPRVVLVNRCMVFDDKGRILLIKRSKHETRHVGMWEFPGGKLDEGQDISHALEREVLEETGLFIHPTSRIAYIESEIIIEGPYKNLPYVVIVGVGNLVGGEIKLSKEHDGYKWVKPKNAYKLALKPEIRKAIAALTSNFSK